LAILEGLEKYPSSAEFDSAARQQCTVGLENSDGQLAATAAWDPPSVLRDLTYIAGACFVFNKSGHALPPRQ